MSWAVKSSFKTELHVGYPISLEISPISLLTKTVFHASNWKSQLSGFGLGSVRIVRGSHEERGSGFAVLLATLDDCVVGYSDFHNLKGFTSKKMPNNILQNIC
jgi:hypothetical protein